MASGHCGAAGLGWSVHLLLNGFHVYLYLDMRSPFLETSMLSLLAVLSSGTPPKVLLRLVRLLRSSFVRRLGEDRCSFECGNLVRQGEKDLKRRSSGPSLPGRKPM